MHTDRRLALKVFSRLATAWSSGQLYPDVVVHVDDGNFDCHRFILAANSGFFSGLFRSGMKEATATDVLVHGIKSSTFRLILSRIYEATAVITAKNVIELWQAAMYLDIDFLVSECEKFLIAHLHIDTCYYVYSYAKHFGSKNVSSAAFFFTLSQFDQVITQQQFLDMSADDLYEMIRHRRLRSQCEEKIVAAVLQWFLNDPSLLDKPVEMFAANGQNTNRQMSQADWTSTQAENVLKVEELCKELSKLGNLSENPNISASRRVEDLGFLLTACRLFHVSKGCLHVLFRTPLVMSQPKAKGKIIKAKAISSNKLSLMAARDEDGHRYPGRRPRTTQMIGYTLRDTIYFHKLKPELIPNHLQKKFTNKGFSDWACDFFLEGSRRYTALLKWFWEVKPYRRRSGLLFVFFLLLCWGRGWI